MLKQLGNALIEEEGNNGIHTGLDGVEGHDETEKIDNHLSGHAHEEGGYKKVGGYHNNNHRDNAGNEGEGGTFFAFMSAINKRGDEDKGACGYYVHQYTIYAALGADGKTLNKRSHNCYAYTCKGAEGKAADEYGNVRRVILKESYLRENGYVNKVYKHNGYGYHNSHSGKFASTVFCVHGFSSEI